MASRASSRWGLRGAPLKGRLAPGATGPACPLPPRSSFALPGSGSLQRSLQLAPNIPAAAAAKHSALRAGGPENVGDLAQLWGFDVGRGYFVFWNSRGERGVVCFSPNWWTSVIVVIIIVIIPSWNTHTPLHGSAPRENSHVNVNSTSDLGLVPLGPIRMQGCVYI